jgi:hypothetical protein
MLGKDQNMLGTAVKVSRILFSVPAQGFQKLLQAISIHISPRSKVAHKYFYNIAQYEYEY